MDCLTYSNKANYQINNFDSIEELCLAYLEDKGLKNINKAVIGVAAPISVSYTHLRAHET